MGFHSILSVILFAGLVSADIYEEIAANTTILYYPTNNVSDVIVMPLGEANEMIPTLREYDVNLPTLFYHPGWGEDAEKNDDCINKILPTLVQLNYTNIFIINYARAFTPMSEDLSIDEATAHRIHDVGHVLGLGLRNYTYYVQDKSLVRLVGWSIGAQVMAQVAHTYTVYSSDESELLPRLTALDPIGWNTKYPLHHELDSMTANFVQVIHTDAKNYGYDYNIGTHDFYVDLYNNTNSPCFGSTEKFCSHNLALRYYSESILNNGNYVAGYFSSYCNMYWDCDSYQNIQAVMGYYANAGSVPGTYYLNSVNKTLALQSYDN